MIPMNNEHLDKTLSMGKAKVKGASKRDADPLESNKDSMQGEGNYEAAKEFNEAEHLFVESGKVPEAARAAAPTSEAEERDMIAAEKEGIRRVKGDRLLPVKQASAESASREVLGSDSGQKRG